MEGQFRTEVGAPLRIGGIPNEDARVTHYAIELPGLLSWLAYSDTTAVVRGLDAFPREDTPPVAVVHIAFQFMVGIGIGLLARGGLVFLALETPPLWEGFRLRAWPMIGVSVVAGLFSLWALVRRHFTAAFLGAPCTVATVIWGWGLAQYPLLVPPTLTLEAAKSPEGVLWFLVYSVAAGSVFLVPALGYLFYLFKGQRPA